jgi:hypothetical protein
MRAQRLSRGDDARLARAGAGRLRRGHAMLIAGLVVAALLAIACASASALIVQLPGRTLSYQPVPGTLGAAAKPAAGLPFEYHGGPVMPSNTNYALYWDPAGASAYPAEYQPAIDSWFENLAHDSGGLQNTDSVLVQYGDTAGEFANYDSHFGGALIDTTPYPASGCAAAPICLTDEQLRTEIRQYAQAHGLPIDLSHEYFLLTPPGVESCFEELRAQLDRRVAPAQGAQRLVAGDREQPRPQGHGPVARLQRAIGRGERRLDRILGVLA